MNHRVRSQIASLLMVDDVALGLKDMADRTRLYVSDCFGAVITQSSAAQSARLDSSYVPVGRVAVKFSPTLSGKVVGASLDYPVLDPTPTGFRAELLEAVDSLLDRLWLSWLASGWNERLRERVGQSIVKAIDEYLTNVESQLGMFAKGHRDALIADLDRQFSDAKPDEARRKAAQVRATLGEC